MGLGRLHRRRRFRKRPKARLAFGLAFLCCASPHHADAWGFAAHRRIVDAAIHWLPDPLHGFFKSHHQWLKEHALDADLRKHTVQGESERHYIDLDRYSPSLDTLKSWFPLSWEDAKVRWTEDTLLAHGIGPWNAESTYQRLVRAFAACDEQGILRCAVDLAHYIGDLHVPLHTTANYNGQFSGQKGIHALWETHVPEAFMDAFNLAPGPSHRPLWIPIIREVVWEITLESHACLPLVYAAEQTVRRDSSHLPVDAYVTRGRSRQLMRSPAFVQAYRRQLTGQVEQRMASACQRISDLWYSAWVEAGEPPLHSADATASSGWKKVLDWILK